MSQTTSATKTPTSSAALQKKRSLDDYQNMTPQALIAALQERDELIAKLQGDNKRLKTTASAPVAAVSPEKVQEKATRLRTLAYKGIKSQMKWKPSCKRGNARFAYEGVCDEATFRVFMRIAEKDKTKGKRMEAENFQDEILGETLSASIRYGYLYLKGTVGIAFKKEDNIIKITGGYGM